MNINLKRALALILSVIMSLSCVSFFAYGEEESAKTETEMETNNDVGIAVVGGIHFVSENNRGGSDTSFLLESRNLGIQVEQLDGLLSSGFEAIKSLKKEGVDYLVVTGGLTYNGYLLDHTEMADMLEKFETESGISVIVVPGENDIYSRSATFYAAGKKQIGDPCSNIGFRNTYKKLGRDLSVRDSWYKRSTTDNSTGTNSFSIDLNDKYRLIVIDATSYKDEKTYANMGRNVVGNISDSLMDWISDQCLEATMTGRTPIGVCGWNIKQSGGFSVGNVLENADDTAYKLADAGMHYILTGGDGRNDISSTVNINGETIYDIQSADLTSFPNTIRKCVLTDDGVKTSLVDVDSVKPVVSYLNNSETPTIYTKPFRETSSLRIQYENYDLAKYALNFVKDFVYNSLIPGVEQYGSLQQFFTECYDIDFEAFINKTLGGGITLFGFLTFFDAKNVMNLLEKSVLPQLEEKFLKDPDEILDIFYKGFKTITSAVIMKGVPCDNYIQKYFFGDFKNTTVNDLLLSLIIVSKTGNEDISNNESLNEVGKYIRNGQLVTFLADVLADGLVKQIVVDGFLDNIDVDLEDLMFLDKDTDSFGSYINTAVKMYLKLHNNSGTYKGLLSSLLKDGLFKDYGRTIDEAVDTYLSKYFEGDRAQSVGVQLSQIYDYYTVDCDPKEKSDYDCTVKYPGKQSSPEELIDELKPSVTTISYGYDPTTSVCISWYTSPAAVNSNIEIYNRDTSFKGKDYVGMNDVFCEKTQEQTTRTYSKIDFGVTDIGTTTVDVIRHKVTLYDLKPNTKYYFRIGDENLNMWSKTLTVKTAPASGKFSFVQITDTSGILQSHFDMDKNLANCIASVCKDSSFTLHTGNFVSNGDDYKQWQSLTKSMSSLMSNYVTVPVPGVSEFNSNAISDNFNPYGFLNENDKEIGYYSFNIGDAHVTVLDSTNLRVIGGLTSAQTKWIQNDIKNSNKKWNIVAVHNSVYTNGYSTQSKRYANYFKNLNDTLSGLRVDLVLSGDSDVYYRTDSVRDNRVDQVPTVKYQYLDRAYKTLVKPKGIVYSSIGASGKNGYAKHETYDTSKFFSFTGISRNDSLPMFQKITIDGDAMILEAYTVSGNTVKLIDSLMIRKSGKEFTMGDVNGDGRITPTDARIALRISAKLEKNATDFTKNIADVDGNGRVTTSDARLILRVSAKLEDFSAIKNGGITLLF